MALTTTPPVARPEATDAATPARRSPLVLGALATAQFMVVLDASIVNVALPSIRAGLGLSGAATTWVVDGYLVAFAGLLLLGGRLTDVVPARRVFLAGLTLFAAASAACAVAPTGVALVAARVVQGVGAAALAPAALSILMAIYPHGDGRARALGVWGAVSGAGGIAGVVLGGVLAETVGWPAIFAINVPVAVVVAVVVVRRIPLSPAAGGSLDLAGAVTVSVGMAALALGLVEGSSRGWTDVRAVTALATGVLALVLFALVETRATHPLVPPAALRRPGVVSANVVMMLVGGVTVSMFFLLPQYQQAVLGMSPTVTSLSQVPLAVMITTGSLAAPRLATRFGAVRTLAASLVLLLLGLAWLARAATQGGYVELLLGPFLLVGAAVGVSFVQVTTLALAGAVPGEAGLMSGLINASRQMGGALGLAAVVAVAQSIAATGAGLSYRAAFVAMAALTGLALLSLAVRRTPAAPTAV